MKMQIMTAEEAVEYMCGLYTPKSLLNKASTRTAPSLILGRRRVFVARELDLWRDAGATPEAAREINKAREDKAKKAIKQL